MLYKKNNSKELDLELFKNPTAEYRGTPFWAWNCELDRDELLRQIEILKKMGFGGFHMHVRAGMATKYLSDEFMSLIKACNAKAKEENMLSWLYDEDRWPSGSAGGYVTKNPEYRQRYLLITMNREENTAEKEIAVKEGGVYLLGCYDVLLNEDGTLKKYRSISENEAAEGRKWYAYVKTMPKSGWHNGETYVDTLNKRAIDKFIEITHEKYKAELGEEFGKSIPAIFTDEPQFSFKHTLSFAEGTEEVVLTWTPDFDESFKQKYGIDIVKYLPELLWDLPEGAVSEVRYRYHDHVCEQFTQAFADNCGKWCLDNGIYLTGHMLCEENLYSQTMSIGETMRAYRSFGLPGIDMLCDATDFSTAKQAQSAVHQYGREGMMSELYGVTNWTFNFEGHKFQGDWQAALGVTVRVPHLAWVSMKGSAKRDFPASINYQSPWYGEYSYIENYFARLNTVLTRGKPVVDVAVIHPIESYWLHWGPSENTAGIRNQMEDNFRNIIDWLLCSAIDFDFVCESTLPELYKETDSGLQVGVMNYGTVIVPNCETIRKTTLEALKRFKASDGRIIFMGQCPRYVDAVKAGNDIAELYAASEKIPFDKLELLNALSAERRVTLREFNGHMSESLIYNMREDNGVKWLFIANGRHGARTGMKQTVISVEGKYIPTVYDTLNGMVKKINFTHKNGKTIFEYRFNEADSLLVQLKDYTANDNTIQAHEAAAAELDTVLTGENREEKIISEIDFRTPVSYMREEENVCLLDMAEYSLDGGEKHSTEELLRIDSIFRKQLGWSGASGEDIQPWVFPKEANTHFVDLDFNFESEIEVSGCCFAAEEVSELSLNGEKVKLEAVGYYVDKSIIKYKLPSIKAGKNTITARIPFGKRTGLEWCYILGEFNVKLEGCKKTLVPVTETIGFGNIVSQGLPFYGGNLTYITEADIPGDTVLVNTAAFKGSLVKVLVDGRDCGIIAFSPYELKIPNVGKGKHKIEFKLFGNRFNTFGALHRYGKYKWYGPNAWYTKGDEWCYEYNTAEFGILKSPVIKTLG